MRIQLVTDDMPACGLWMGRHNRLDMRQGIGLGACWAAGRSQQLSRHYIAAQDEGARAMPHVLEFAPLNFARGERQSGIPAWKPPAPRSIRRYSRTVRPQLPGEEPLDTTCRSLSPFPLVVHPPVGLTNTGSDAAGGPLF